MNLKEWQMGMNEFIKKSSQLITDGKILMDNGSYGHSIFLFITSFEEMAGAYYILENFNTPKLEQLKKGKFLKHLNKYSLSRFKFFPIAGHFNYLDDYLTIIRQKVDTNESLISKEFQKQLKLLELKIQKEDKLWEIRNESLYVSYETDSNTFKSPQNFSKSLAYGIFSHVSLYLILLCIDRDIAFKFGAEFSKLTEDDLLFSENWVDIVKITKLINEKKKDQIINHPKLDVNLKNILLDIISDSNKILDLDTLNKYFYLIFKDYSEIFKKTYLNTGKVKILQYVLDRLKSKYGVIGLILHNSLKFSIEIATGSFNIQNYPALLYFIQNSLKSKQN